VVAGPDVTVEAPEPSVLQITGLSSEQVGEAAAAHGIVLYELVPQEASLEEAFMELTREEVEFHADTHLLDEEPEEAVA
jgi:ABC-2 type transport system ATP-binding protein